MLRRALLSARRGGVAAVLALALVGAAAPAGSARTPAAEAVAVPTGADYVALGDSYSAAPLVPGARIDPRGCLRSTNNYPAFLAGHLGVATYRDVTCSGAWSADLTASQQLFYGDPAPPQLDALSADTDVVTLGIGGNDFGLFGSMIATCARLAAGDPHGSPCRRAFTVDGVDTKARDARRIQRNVGRALTAVHRRAPGAEVYLVGYPRLLPANGSCSEVGFATGDYGWGRRVERLLNRSLHRAALRHRTTYVDLRRATLGRDACAGDEAWVNGKEIVFGRAASFHPFLEGERGIAGVVYRRMTGLEAPANEQAEPPPGSVVLNGQPAP